MYPGKWKRTKKVISLMTAFTMLSSAMGATTVSASVHWNGQPVTAEASEPEILESQPMMLASSTVSGPAVEASKPESQLAAGENNAGQPLESSGTAEKAAGPTYQEVYSSMIKLKEQYPEGMTWNNFEPYGSKGNLGSAYRWKGGNILGNVSSGVGCAAFAFILSDAAFGELPAREIAVNYENVHVGDILRINNNTHSVIVLQKTAAGVTVAEGNYNNTVHWGRALSKEEVERANFVVTRYPVNYDPSNNPEDDTIAFSGKTGSLDWSLTSGGILTISGSGDMENFAENNQNQPWNVHNDKINTIVIGNGVTSIGDYAFYNSPASSVYISSGVKKIGQSAFSGSGILSVTIPGTVEAIENNAFANCLSLISVSISEGVKTIGDSAFISCGILKYIDFPSSITAVGNGAFTNCHEMYSVRFKPGSVTVSIGDNLFTECWNLQQVILPEKIDRISSGMFSNCKGISELYLPAGIRIETTAGGAPFFGCVALKNIYFAGSESEWDNAGGKMALIYSGNIKPNVKCNTPFPNPFAEDPNDPGDLIIGDHIHNWSTADWNHDGSYHWHECTAASCPVTASYEKNGYAQHSYGSWVVDVDATSYESGSKHRDCTVCAYRQTENIPAAGSGSSSSDNFGSSGGSWSWGSSWGSWGSGSFGSSSGSSNKPSVPSTPDSTTVTDSSDSSLGNTDNSSDSNTADSSSSDSNDSGNSENVSDKDDTKISASVLKQQKTKLKKELKTGLKQQIKSQVKINLKKELKKELGQAKAKLKKQLKAKIKPQVKAKLKKQMKKQFGKTLGDEFSNLFNELFNEQFNKVFNDQFNAQYKQLSSKKVKK